jgi:hypothetical protein
MRIDRTLAARIEAEVKARAAQRAFDWRWDAAHGEVMDPAWARRLADDLEATDVWFAPAEAAVKVRVRGGQYTAYELLEGALSELLTAEQFMTGIELDWRGGTKGVAVVTAA